MTSAVAYLDECGDLGWKLDAEYQKGGSSQFFIVSFVVGLNQDYRRFQKIMDKLYKTQNWTSRNEKKWKNISHRGKEEFFNILVNEINIHNGLKIYAAVFKKTNLPTCLNKVDDGKTGLTHLIYAAMMSAIVEKFIQDHQVINLSYCPDDLNESVRVLESILNYQIILKNRSHINLKRMIYSHPMKGGLSCADMIAGSVWEAYEKNNDTYLKMIGSKLSIVEILK